MCDLTWKIEQKYKTNTDMIQEVCKHLIKFSYRSELKFLKNYHFRNELFPCIPLKHDIPDVVVGNCYNSVSKNSAIDEENFGEKY